MLSKDKKYQLKYAMRRAREMAIYRNQGCHEDRCYEDNGYEAWDVREIVIQCIHETQEHRPRGGCGKPKPF